MNSPTVRHCRIRRWSTVSCAYPEKRIAMGSHEKPTLWHRWTSSRRAVAVGAAGVLLFGAVTTASAYAADSGDTAGGGDTFQISISSDQGGGFANSDGGSASNDQGNSGQGSS